MTTPKTAPIWQSGSELIKECSNRSGNTLPLATQLFPYIFIAARTMSLREISAWLQTEKKVKISAMALSRALRQPELHLGRLASHILSKAQYVSLGTKAGSPMHLLYEEVEKDGSVHLEELARDWEKAPLNERQRDLWDSIHELNGLWASIPYEVCVLLRPYIDYDDHEEGAFQRGKACQAEQEESDE
jgi:hypothetical protein